jgi:type I restriction enzyme S subunit
VSKNDLTLHGLGNQLVYSEKIKNEVAKGWSVTTVGDLLACDAIVKIQDGNHGEIHPKSSDYIDHGIPFIMANSLENGGVNFSKSKKLPQDITDRLRVGFSYPGDVLLSHKGTIGEVAIVPQEIAFPYLMLTPQVTLYRPNEHKLKGKFLFYVFSAKHFQSQLSVISAQSTRAYVGKTAQQKLRLAIPDSLIEQERIVGFLDELDGLVRLMDDLIAYSRLLQKSLINEVFPI